MRDVIFKRALGGFLAVVGLLMLSSVFAACASMGMSCDFDSDCDHGELCVEYMCVSPCTSDQQCEGANTCQVFIRENESDQVHVCMDPFVSQDPNNDDSTDSILCSGDEECREIFGSSWAFCGLGYRCVDAEPEGGASPGQASFNSVLIRDVTSRDSLDEEGHRGVVLSAVFVRDEGGAIVGYGNTVAFVSGEENGGQADGHLNGQSVQLDESGRCVAGVDPLMSVLGGEGGSYLVGFVDYQGVPISLGHGWKVIVITRDGQCSEEMDSPDESGEYEVSLCVSTAGMQGIPDADCQRISEKVSGYAEFLVTTNG